ncbi:ABC transporter permease subunit [Leptospira sarikeiensis]|uniref:Gliding motility ABC transporter n=1 Tax=Leptospira sarikeiensis TaxID=2484943 RepID=A0A4R9JYX1_9LEPT|nr:ABC transporter permease subunit [Leptospira sarikeiensis]TGL58479.1 gliding motility ABC transporter [Leptospira sarikeiensis]
MKFFLTKPGLIAVFKKEWGTYFNTPIGYVFSILYLFLSSFLFFYGLGEGSFWDRKIAGMEEYFVWTPLLFVVFIPAITMRLWSEEKRSGSIEVLFTLPISKWEIVAGKFLAAWAFLGLVICFSLSIPFFIWALGDLDLGIVFAGYLGCFLLGGAYISLGIFLSSFGKDQINSYILTLLISLLLFFLGTQPVLKFLEGGLSTFAYLFAISSHFESFRLGILDLSDLFYFFSFILGNLWANVFFLRRNHP